MWFLLACTPATVYITYPDVMDTLEEVPSDTYATSTSTDVKTEYDGTSDAWMFDQTVIHRIDLTIGTAGKSALNKDPYTPVEGDFKYDGESVDSVGIRLRGKIGSYRDTYGKPKWAIDFDKFVPEQRFFGLESLSLNNEVVDCSYVREPLGYWMFELAGVPSLRTSFAEVYVDGDAYGLYVVVETPDDRYLHRTYADDSGNLYDGKYVWYGDYNYTLLDFNSTVDNLFQLEEGTDVAKADIHAITDAVEANYGKPTFYEEVGKVLDWDEYLRELAAEQLTGHNDGYALNTNNYRIYFDPADGKADMLPWDLDYAFLEDSWWSMNWQYPRGVLASGCFADATCRQKEKEVMAELLANFDEVEYRQRYTTYQALIQDLATNDPRRECGIQDVRSTWSYMEGYGATRVAELKSFWGL